MSPTDCTIAHIGIAVVDFWAAWCGPCQMIAPLIEQLADEYEGKVKVAKVDVDANQQITARFNVRSIPAVLLFKNGELAETLVGLAEKEDIARLIEKHL